MRIIGNALLTLNVNVILIQIIISLIVILIFTLTGLIIYQVNKRQREFESVIAGVTKIYDAFVLINLSTGRYKYVGSSVSSICEGIPAFGLYEDLKKHFISIVSFEEDKKRIDEVLTKESVVKLLGQSTDHVSIPCRIGINGEIYEILNVTCVKRKKMLPVELVITKQNISNIKQEELESFRQLQNKIEKTTSDSIEKTGYIYSVSHDIRTPMNAIIGLADLAKVNINDSVKLSKYLDNIKQSGQYLLELINYVLEVSRIENGLQILENNQVSLRSIFSEIVLVDNEIARKKNIKISTDINIRNEFIITDCVRLKQVIVNLLSNAIKFSPNDSYVKLAVTENPKCDGDYIIVVKDYGIGIASDELDKLFKPFFRTNNSKNIEGTGLGLSIVKKIVECMGGTITCESKIGQGTCFKINLKFQLAKKIEEKEPTFIYGNLDFRGKVLVAEDNSINQLMICEMLDLFKVKYDLAYNGQDALDKIKGSNNKYSLVLMDVEMPILGGYEATKLIRSDEREEIRNLPIVAMTANAFEEDVVKAKEMGMDYHLAKPINIEKLYKTLSLWIRNDVA